MRKEERKLWADELRLAGLRYNQAIEALKCNDSPQVRRELRDAAAFLDSVDLAFGKLMTDNIYAKNNPVSALLCLSDNQDYVNFIFFLEGEVRRQRESQSFFRNS